MNREYFRYIDFLCDLLTIEMPIIQFKKNGKYYNQYGKSVTSFEVRNPAYAITYPDKNLIQVDLDKFDNNTKVYIVLAHEIRHIYQYVALYVDDELREDLTKEELTQWDKEANHYQNSSDPNYINQSIEIDAVAFSYIVCLVIFKIEVTSNCNKKDLKQRINILMEDYTQEEILECAWYAGFQPRHIQA